MVRNVYEGTIPDKYFKISVFLLMKLKLVKNNILPKNISNKFRKIKWLIIRIMNKLRFLNKLFF